MSIWSDFLDIQKTISILWNQSSPLEITTRTPQNLYYKILIRKYMKLDECGI